MTVDGRPDLLEQRKHRSRPTRAVQSDDVRTGVLESLAGVLRRPPFARRRVLVDRERDHRRQTGRLNRLEGEERLLTEREGLTHDVVHAGVDRPRDLLLEHRPNRGSRVGVVDEHIRVADVAREQRAGLVGDVLRERERLPVELLEQVLLVDHA